MRNANLPPDMAEPELEPELADALKLWQAPQLPASLNQRVLASYRQQLTRVPFWRRFFTTSIAVPLPLVVVQAMLLVIATAAIFMFSAERQSQEIPLAQQPRPAEIIPAPIAPEPARSKTILKTLRVRPTKAPPAVVTLPLSTVIAPTLATAPVEWRESLQPTPAVVLEAPALAANAPEQRLSFTPALNFKVNFPDPLKFELPPTVASEFLWETALEKTSFFETRISRPLSRASNWVMTKPLEKGAGLYRALPRTLPTLNSFIAPAKDACLAPFRSNAPVNVQIN